MTEETAVTEKVPVTAAIAAWLRTIEDKHGRLAPAIVEEEARPEDSPGHPYFTWDDAEAASAFRLEQARTLIRRVKFEVWYEDEPMRVVLYVAEPDADEAMYLSVPKIRQKGQAVGVMAAELARILGNVNRSLGIARVKAAQLPAGIPDGLEVVRQQVESLLADCRG